MMPPEQTLFPDSIYALSSGSVPAGVAVLRLSGRGVRRALEHLTGRLPADRKAVLRAVRSPQGELIDRGLVLFFPGPTSFTGEDCAELHLHGGKAVVAAAMAALSCIADFRQAEPGEFARRAFLNGKMDLTSAEALADLIAAETESQRRLALENAGGRQERLYRSWRDRLLRARALIEAVLDFSDEGDVGNGTGSLVWPDMASLRDEIGQHLAGQRAALIVREGFRVVVAGAPNAGKSSLVNALAKRDVAIVTEIPGTTRDVLETTLDLGGYKVILSDTAGFRPSEDRIEMIGIDRARAAVEAADLVLHLVTPGCGSKAAIMSTSADVLTVRSKVDIYPVKGDEISPDFAISSVTGDGIDCLIEEISRHARNAASASSAVLPTRIRHIRLLEEGRQHLSAAIDAQDAGDEICAEELRLCERALARIIGATDVEEVLGEIFSRFCIGK